MQSINNALRRRQVESASIAVAHSGFEPHHIHSVDERLRGNLTRSHTNSMNPVLRYRVKPFHSGSVLLSRSVAAR